jgi:hypothetical protein
VTIQERAFSLRLRCSYVDNKVTAASSKVILCGHLAASVPRQADKQHSFHDGHQGDTGYLITCRDRSADPIKVEMTWMAASVSLPIPFALSASRPAPHRQSGYEKASRHLVRATAAIRSSSGLARLTDDVQRVRVSCRERLPSSLGLRSKFQSREPCDGAICGLYRDLNPERGNSAIGCRLARLDALLFWRLRTNANSTNRLLPFVMVRHSTFATARYKGLGNPRCLQTRLGQADGDPTGLCATVGTHRHRKATQYRAKAQCKNYERDEDFE